MMVIKNVRFLYSHFLPMAEAVARAGWEVWIVAEQNEDPDRLFKLGIRFIGLKCEGSHWNPFDAIRSALGVFRALRRVKPDVVHFIYLKNVLSGGLLARINRAPAVIGAITGLGSLFAQDRFAYKLLRVAILVPLRLGFRHRNAVLAFENRDDLGYFVSHGVIEENRTVIIPGAGVETDEIQPLPEPGGIPVILCAARMIRDKGILVLVEAARILKRRGLRFELQLAGASDWGNPSAITPQELEEIEAEGVAKWLGQRTDIGALLGLSSIFCLPTYYREGLPKVLVEAGSAGLPIVTTNVPGCRDVVIDGINGVLVPPRDAVALANALQLLLENPEVRSRMRIASRQIFEQKFTSDAVRNALNQCYSILSVPLILS